jgi:CheY-like chemotaxis protein
MPGRENKTRRILVVDDEALIRETVRRVLVSDGHSVETATNGREALALFEEAKFDLVIMDYDMPDIRGDELAMLLKALCPKQPIAIVTGYPQTVLGNLLTDVDLILSKPFDPQELRLATNKIFANG